MKSRSLIQVPHILILQSQSCLLTEYRIRRPLNLAKAFAFQCESSRKEIACYVGKYPRKTVHTSQSYHLNCCNVSVNLVPSVLSYSALLPTPLYLSPRGPSRRGPWERG